MKSLYIILILFFCTQCRSIENPVIENDIYIVSLDKDFDASGKLILNDTSKVIKFSKDFWNYFIRTHPKTTSLLFISPLLDTSNNYFSLGDTSLQFYNTGRLNSYYFIRFLADSVEGKEKDDVFSGSGFFVIPDNTSSYNAKEKRIEQRLKGYKITPAVREEFNRLKSILTWKDTSNNYVVVFKKKFVENIYKLYE